MIAKDAPDDRFVMLLYLANRYNLDPIQREIELIKFGKEHQIFIGVNTKLKKAMATGLLTSLKKTLILDDGSEVEFCNDFDRIQAAKCVIKKYNEATGQEHEFSFVASRTAFYPKNKVAKDEYGFLTWSKMFDVMLMKCAMSRCLSDAFGIIGYDEAEMYWVKQERDITGKAQVIEQTQTEQEKIKELRENTDWRELAINLTAIYSDYEAVDRTKYISELCSESNWDFNDVRSNLIEQKRYTEIPESIMSYFLDKKYTIPYCVNLLKSYNWDMALLEDRINKEQS
jgi:hypothetical protein